jgi:hypothetical protein|nr:MAG TPA: hypothetical protein [Caudoviricetes sp.]
MANDYADGNVRTRMMTDEERGAYRTRREQERLRYPWRYRGGNPEHEYACYAGEKKKQCEARKKRGRK